MEHYITEIKIEKLRHLSDIVISLNQEQRQHLIITGKNGSGKTSLLLAVRDYLKAVNNLRMSTLKDYDIPRLKNVEKRIEEAESEVAKAKAEKTILPYMRVVNKYKKGIDISFSQYADLDDLYREGKFIIAYFPPDRRAEIPPAKGVEDVTLDTYSPLDAEPGQLLQKYMVHLKTQQSYARNEGDLKNADRIQKWFDRFVDALRILLDDDSVTLSFEYKGYVFKIHQQGREPFGFDELSDGYSAVIYILSDLILRMDQNWLLGDSLSEYNTEGIVLIDELETHLHIEMQKKILPFLTTFFPRIQFIVTTHSPYILNSISNAKAYDLEQCIELENLSLYSADGLAEAYFGADEYADDLREKIEQYRKLTENNAALKEMFHGKCYICEIQRICQGISGG